MDLFSSLSAIEFCALGSGSSGNCYYVGHQEGALLVDIGISAKKIEKLLNEIGKSISMIQAVLITHDHIDHIKAAERFTRKYKIPIYTTAGTFKGIQENRFTSFADPNCFNTIYPGKAFIVAGFEITPFSVSHDAKESIGFYIRNSLKSIYISTDLGQISHASALYIKTSNIIVLESNHDLEMLANGPYPAYLQKRIRSDIGHLSNDQASEFLASHWNDSISHVFLAHLSEHNNSQEKALETLKTQLLKKGVSINKHVHIEALQQKKRSLLHRIP